MSAELLPLLRVRSTVFTDNPCVGTSRAHPAKVAYRSPIVLSSGVPRASSMLKGLQQGNLGFLKLFLHKDASDHHSKVHSVQTWIVFCTRLLRWESALAVIAQQVPARTYIKTLNHVCYTSTRCAVQTKAICAGSGSSRKLRAVRGTLYSHSTAKQLLWTLSRIPPKLRTGRAAFAEFSVAARHRCRRSECRQVQPPGVYHQVPHIPSPP